MSEGKEKPNIKSGDLIKWFTIPEENSKKLFRVGLVSKIDEKDVYIEWTIAPAYHKKMSFRMVTTLLRMGIIEVQQK